MSALHKISPRVLVGPSMTIRRADPTRVSHSPRIVLAPARWQVAAWRLCRWPVGVLFSDWLPPVHKNASEPSGAVIEIDGGLCIFIAERLSSADRVLTLAHECEHVRRREWAKSWYVIGYGRQFAERAPGCVGKRIDEAEVERVARERVARAEAELSWPFEKTGSYWERVIERLHS